MSLEEIQGNFQNIPFNEQQQIFQDLYNKHLQEFQESDEKYFYLMSKQWIQKWQNSEQDAEHEKFNEDLFIKNEENIELNQNLQENEDFIIVNQEIMELFHRNYEGILIQKPTYIDNENQKKIDLNPLSINLIIIDNESLKNIDQKKIDKFDIIKKEISGEQSLCSFKDFCMDICKQRQIAQRKFFNVTGYNNVSDINIENIRLWKVNSPIDEFFTQIQQLCNISQTYEYMIRIDEELLEQQQKKLNNLDINERYIIIDLKMNCKQWNLLGQEENKLQNCEFCLKYIPLIHQCECEKVFYCSQLCKAKDLNYHQEKCEKSYDIEIEEADIQQLIDTKQGLCGLNNLGLTCYINSALQCLSHFKTLTDYFLQKKYIDEINVQNILGYQGKLAKAYGNILKQLWLTKSEIFSPIQFKRQIQKLNPMFTGMVQHDSSEFLSWLLDALHEDLNRVQDKPYTETVDSNGRQDYVVAEESWINHLKRNQSIIVDQMHGQFKSCIKCPECLTISNCFDPFMMCNLPLPQGGIQKLLLYYLYKDVKKKASKINLKFLLEDCQTVSDLIKELAKLLDIKKENIILAFLSFKEMDILLQDTVSIVEVQKIEKNKNLFAIEVTQQDLDIPQEFKKVIPVKITKNEQNQTYSKDCTFVRPFFFDVSQTLKQIHFKIFQYMKFLFEDNEQNAEQMKDLTDEEIFDLFHFQNKRKYFQILLHYQQQIFIKIKSEQLEFPVTISITIDRVLNVGRQIFIRFFK